MVASHLLMQIWQPVERDIRDRMMLYMKGHVPRQEPNDPVGICGARVLKHIRHKGTAAMFGQEIQPQKRHPKEQWQGPDPQQQIRERETCQRKGIEHNHPLRLSFDFLSRGRRNIIPGITPRCVSQYLFHHAKPIRQPRDVPNVGAPGLGFMTRQQLWVFPLDIGVAMMREVKVAEPQKGLEDQEACDMADDLVEPFGFEGSLVGGFMLQRKEEHECDAKRKYGERPKEDFQSHKTREHRDDANVPSKMPQTRAIMPNL